MYLHPNMLQTPHYQVISVLFASHKHFKLMSSIFIGVSHGDMKSNERVWSEVWREERRRRRWFHRGRRCSLQHDGNKEQMERTRRNELTFIFSLPSIFFFLPSFLSFQNFFPQEWGYTLTPLPMRTRTKLCVSSPKRSTPPASRLRKLLASVRSYVLFL